jgi:branched-subunit amino acid aminotransferase/4-amino-4-deoxychorismate lyase
MHVYLNGQMLDAADASVSVEDAGFQHAVGLFETMIASRGRVFRIRQHLERLQQSARDLGLARELDLDSLEHAVRQTIEHNELSEARVRLTVTAGAISLLRKDASPGSGQPPQPTVLVAAQPPTRYDPAYFENGVMALIAPPAANPFDPLAGHKTLSYWGRLRTLRQAAAAGAGEAIWLNVSNHLAGGAISNIFLVKDKRLLTPFSRGEETAGSLPAPVLPGVTRAAILEVAASLGIEAERKMLSVPDLLDADEVFLTNSSWLVLPVTRVEKKTIGDGKVGQTTRRLRAALVELIARETSEP